MKKVFGFKVDEFAEAAIFSLAWTAGLTSAYVAYFGKREVFLAACIFLFISSVGMYYFLKFENYRKARREVRENGDEAAREQVVEPSAEQSQEEDDSLTAPSHH